MGVCDWIKLIRAGKFIKAEDKPDATPAQCAAANDVMTRINNLKFRAMAALPKPAAEVAKQVPKKV